jgi:PAS domain S-box-containing protein
VLEFNPAAEKMFGRIESEVAGKEMAELIIPERFRSRHREGMARYLVTGHGRLLNRWLEMTALRRDGSEFPVELTITQISGEGPPVFCGFVRDITDRRRLRRRGPACSIGNSAPAPPLRPRRPARRFSPKRARCSPLLWITTRRWQAWRRA